MCRQIPTGPGEILSLYVLFCSHLREQGGCFNLPLAIRNPTIQGVYLTHFPRRMFCETFYEMPLKRIMAIVQDIAVQLHFKRAHRPSTRLVVYFTSLLWLVSWHCVGDTLTWRYCCNIASLQSSVVLLVDIDQVLSNCLSQISQIYRDISSIVKK